VRAASLSQGHTRNLLIECYERRNDAELIWRLSAAPKREVG
jgi:hypothetical protein